MGEMITGTHTRRNNSIPRKTRERISHLGGRLALDRFVSICKDSCSIKIQSRVDKSSWGTPSESTAHVFISCTGRPTKIHFRDSYCEASLRGSNNNLSWKFYLPSALWWDFLLVTKIKFVLCDSCGIEL